MDLIQTTVVPDTWEALGGPSTMAPYPAGIFVDSKGTIQQCEFMAGDDAGRKPSRRVGGWLIDSVSQSR